LPSHIYIYTFGLPNLLLHDPTTKREREELRRTGRFVLFCGSPERYAKGGRESGEAAAVVVGNVF